MPILPKSFSKPPTMSTLWKNKPLSIKILALIFYGPKNAERSDKKQIKVQQES